MPKKKNGSEITREFISGIGRSAPKKKAAPKKKTINGRPLSRKKGVDTGIMGRKLRKMLGKGGTTGPMKKREAARKKVK